MVRLSSRDTSILVDVLEQDELLPQERLALLEGASPEVREIGEALINLGKKIDDPEIRDAVDAILRWADQTKPAEEQRGIRTE
jgi:hypothetical protein